MSNNRQSWSFLDAPVGKSFAWSLTLSVLPVVSAFAVSWIIARWSGPEVWGTVSWAMAFATAVLIIAKLGIELAASRLASEYGVTRPGTLRALLRTASSMRMLATLAVAVLTFAFAKHVADFFHDPRLVWPVRLSALIIVCASVYEFQEHFLIGLNRHAVVSGVRAAMLSSRTLVTAALVALGYGAAVILGGYALAWFVGIALFTVLVARNLPPGQDPVPTSVLRSRILQLGLPLAISSASVTIYSQMDKLMLGYFDDVHEVGQYSIARAVTEVALFPSFALVSTLRPALASRYASGGLAECATLIQGSLRLSMVAGVWFASVLAVLAVPLLTLVYTSEYAYAGALMTLFAAVIILRSLGALVLPALVAAERTRQYAVLTTVSAILNFGLNVALIPAYHARGAIMATLISYAFLLVVGMRQVFSIFKVELGAEAAGIALRTLLAGGLAGIAVWSGIGRLGGGEGGFVIAWAAVQSVVFVLLVIGFRVIRLEELRRLIRNLLKING